MKESNQEDIIVTSKEAMVGLRQRGEVTRFWVSPESEANILTDSEHQVKESSLNYYYQGETCIT